MNARKEAARANRLRKMTRYVIRVTWQNGSQEDHEYHGSKQAATTRRNARVKSGNIVSGEVLDTWAAGYVAI